MVEILKALQNLDVLPLLVELTDSCPRFSGGNWGKVVLVITLSLLNQLDEILVNFGSLQP